MDRFPDAGETFIGKNSAWVAAGKKTNSVKWECLLSRFLVIKDSRYIRAILNADSSWIYIMACTNDEWTRVQERLGGLNIIDIPHSCFTLCDFWKTMKTIVDPAKWAEYINGMKRYSGSGSRGI